MPMDRAPQGGGMQHEVREAHRRLQELYADVQETLAEEPSNEAARAEFAALRESLDVHFEQEDRLYYSAIRSLRPELAQRVTGFAEQHGRFRNCLHTIDTLLGAGNRAEALSEFAVLTREFGLHEASEEAMLAEMERTPTLD
jgi:hypothetical protein